MAKGGELAAAMQSKDWDKVLSIVEELEKSAPETGTQMAAIRVAVGLEKGDDALIEKYADKFLGSGLINSADDFNKVAWNVVTKLAKPGAAALSVAEKACARAMEKSEGRDSSILKTRARLLFLQGNKDEAVQAQEKAVGLAGDDQKKALTKDLEEYKNGRLPAVEEAAANN